MKYQLARMLETCANEFSKKLDSHWEPYFMHLIRVMQRVPNDEILQCIAIGHDLFEDTDLTESDLMFVNVRVRDWIRDLTKIQWEKYSDYLDRVWLNRDAIIVKLADLEDNLDVRRMKWNTEKDYERAIKYMDAYKTLKSKL